MSISRLRTALIDSNQLYALLMLDELEADLAAVTAERESDRIAYELLLNTVRHERDQLHARASAEIAELRADAERYHIAHDRYETVRRMNLRQFTSIWNQTMTASVRFDDLIDAIRTKAHFNV